MITDNLHNNNNNNNSIYNNYLKSTFNRYINYSELPKQYLQDNIDTTKLPKKLKILYDNIYEIVNNKYNYGISVSDYTDVSAICSLLIKKYFNESVLNDTLLVNVLYIDTPLLLDDYKKLIDKEDLTDESIIHNINTLNTSILTADMIFWDKFTMFNSNFDINKLENILFSRLRSGLGNIFFVKGGKDVLSGMIDEEFAYAMNIAAFINCKQEKVKYKGIEEYTDDR